MGPHKGNLALGRFVINQYDELKKHNKNIDLFLMPSLAYKFKLSFVRYIIFSLSYLWFIFKSLFKSRYDVIHVHFFYPTIFLAIFYKLFINRKAKIIATFHGNDVYSYDVKSSLYSKAMSYVDHAIYVSNRLMARHAVFNNSKSVLPAGIKNDFHPIADVDKKYDFIFVGNLELVKGADRLLSVIDNYPNYRFAVVGSGSFKDKLLKQNSDNFIYFPSLDSVQLSNLMNQANCLLNLSRKESFGLVITEALSCGICVIATRTDGAQEQLESCDCGWILEQNFSVQEIKAVYENHTLNYAANDAIFQATNCFRLDSICNEIYAIYLSVLSK